LIAANLIAEGPVELSTHQALEVKAHGRKSLVQEDRHQLLAVYGLEKPIKGCNRQLNPGGFPLAADPQIPEALLP